MYKIISLKNIAKSQYLYIVFSIPHDKDNNEYFPKLIYAWNAEELILLPLSSSSFFINLETSSKFKKGSKGLKHNKNKLKTDILYCINWIWPINKKNKVKRSKVN